MRFTSKVSFQKWGTLVTEGGFVLSKKYFDQVIVDSKGDLKIIEKLLGFDEGYLKSSDVMIAYIEKKEFINLRLPSGNEGGANKNWTPGGHTSGNTPEAVLDLNKKIKFKELKLKLK